MGSACKPEKGPQSVIFSHNKKKSRTKNDIKKEALMSSKREKL